MTLSPATVATYVYVDAGNHPDHLDTPRHVYDENQQLRWRWDQAEPFGNNPADENPAAVGAFEFNLRYPGQYFDKETNTHYNYFRTYDPGIGRYLRGDPIGLRAGTNLYSYVRSKPIRHVDPLGLIVTVSRRGDNIDVSGSIGVWGPAGDQEQVERIRSAIQRYWNPTGRGLSYGRCRVVVSFDVGQGGSGENTFTVMSPGDVNPDTGTVGDESVVANQTGRIYSNLPAVRIAHEVGHFMNAPDRYSRDPASGFTSPYPGFRDSLMGDLGPVSPQDVELILRANGIDPCTCQ